VEEGEAVRWIGEYCATREVKIDADGARELVDALGGDMMMVSNELEKLILYVGEKKKITLGDVETMVLAAKQRSLYELTDAISSKDRVRALEVLDALLSTGDGEEAAIGHLYMLAKTFRQMLVIWRCARIPPASGWSLKSSFWILPPSQNRKQPADGCKKNSQYRDGACSVSGRRDGCSSLSTAHRLPGVVDARH
jgi:DNA polymerase-3 subunit delta